MKSKLLALVFLAGSTMFAAPRVFVGVNLGYPPPARVVAYVPPSPGYGYTWINGYWYPSGPRWVWRAGYWARPPYARARWVAPRYHGNRFYGGYWRR